MIGQSGRQAQSQRNLATIVAMSLTTLPVAEARDHAP
jgi:hypothetical protein